LEDSSPAHFSRQRGLPEPSNLTEKSREWNQRQPGQRPPARDCSWAEALSSGDGIAVGLRALPAQRIAAAERPPSMPAGTEPGDSWLAARLLDLVLLDLVLLDPVLLDLALDDSGLARHPVWEEMRPAAKFDFAPAELPAQPAERKMRRER